MIELSRKSKNFILKIFFIVILLTCFDIGFSKDYFILRFISFSDEIFILFLFIYVLTKGANILSSTVIKISFIFVMVGAIGNILSHSSLNSFLLGSFNVIKPVLLFYAFSNIDFTINDFNSLMKRFDSFFILFVVGICADILFPQFGDFLTNTLLPNYKHGEQRLGIRCIQGFFPRADSVNVFALVYYIYYKYYVSYSPNWKYYFMIVITFLTLKVKDVLGLILSISLPIFKSIKMWHFVFAGIVFYFLVLLYSILLPEHYNNYMNFDSDSNTARVCLNVTSIRIAHDYIPFGVGFGQFGSPTSRDLDSPIYYEYGINKVYGLNYDSDGGKYMVDTFWPMILGETGIAGTIMFIILLYIVFRPFVKDFLIDTTNIYSLFPSLLFIAMLIISIAKPSLLGPPNSLFLWGIAGIFHSIRNKVTYIN